MTTQALVSEIEKLSRFEQFAGTPHCPHCGSERIKANGKYRSRQRYLCKKCGRSFNDTTASLHSGCYG